MLREESGCMLKIPGLELCDLISSSMKIADINNELIYKISEGQFFDCAVINIKDRTLLFSTDFGSAVGEDELKAGQIAALNAISDIYAMGGEPLFATAIVQYSRNLSKREKERLLAGLFLTCKEEGVVVVGGHTIFGEDTILGLSVIGRGTKNLSEFNNSKVGDAIMISKKIGTGIAFRAYANGLIDKSIYDEAIGIASSSNRVGKEISDLDGLHAMTDITGFGLIGHLGEILGNKKGATLFSNSNYLISGISDLRASQVYTRYIQNNYDYAANTRKLEIPMDSVVNLAWFDPQTNGPLLICIDKNNVAKAVKYGFELIGIVTEGSVIKTSAK